MIELTGQLISSKADSFHSKKDDKDVNFYYIVIRIENGSLLRFKTTEEIQEQATSHLDTEVTVSIEFSSGTEKSTSPKVVALM